MEDGKSFKARMHKRNERENQKMTKFLTSKYGEDGYTHPQKIARLKTFYLSDMED